MFFVNSRLPGQRLDQDKDPKRELDWRHLDGANEEKDIDVANNAGKHKGKRLLGKEMSWMFNNFLQRHCNNSSWLSAGLWQ